MQKKILFSVFIVLILLTGCKKKISDKQSDEIILGRDCGLEDLMCCKGKQQCFEGLQCCVNPLDPTDTYCGLDCQCGTKDSFCCNGNVCDAGLSCQNNRCLACGKTGEVCCDNGDKCVDNLICHNNKCSECGKNNQPCCTGDSCFSKNKIGNNLECINGLCKNCGFDGFKACKIGSKCFSGYIYNNDVCYRCGGINQPCCNKTASVDYQCKDDNLVCNLGFCIDKKTKK